MKATLFPWICTCYLRSPDVATRAKQRHAHSANTKNVACMWHQNKNHGETKYTSKVFICTKYNNTNTPIDSFMQYISSTWFHNEHMIPFFWQWHYTTPSINLSSSNSDHTCSLHFLHIPFCFTAFTTIGTHSKCHWFHVRVTNTY